MVLRVFLKHVNGERLSIDDAFRDRVRVHAATPGRLKGIVWYLAKHDRAWLQSRREELVQTSPDAADSLALWFRRG